MGLEGDQSAGSGTTTIVLAVSVCPGPIASPGKLTGIVWLPCTSNPLGLDSSPDPLLWTWTVNLISAVVALGVSGWSVVAIVGFDSSSTVTGRISTSPSSPPQLNQVR